MSFKNETTEDWQGGIGTIQDRMKYLLETGLDSDVQFLVGKESLEEVPQLIKAHKFILSSSSAVFEAQFRHEHEMPINVIDISASAFKAILNFMYTNDFSLIHNENFLDVYSAAKKYWLHAFVEKCHELAPKMINRFNSVALWMEAKLYDDKILIEHCLQFLDKNNANWSILKLSQADLEELITRDTYRTDELRLFRYIRILF